MQKIKILISCASIFFLGAACTTSAIGSRSDGGVWLSSDKGETWSQRVNIYSDRTIQKTISNVDVKKILFSPEDSRKIFALTEKNGLWISWNSGYNWDLILQNISIYDVAISRENPRKIYAAVGGNIAVSENEGIKWRSTYISDSPSAKITSITIDNKDPSIIYASTNMGNILISEDGGIFWRVWVDFDEGFVFQDMKFHPYEEGVLYAIEQKNGLAKSKDKGRTWEFFKIDGLPRDYNFIPTGILYATSAGLFRSLNFGAEWTSLPLISGKNESNIYSIAANPSNPMEIFYGTKNTIYYSSDGGFNWIPRKLPTTWSAIEIIFNSENPEEIYLGAGRIN